ncbi:D-2-hydroxyacid dehydrogenase [Herbinix luporum]|jgi:phosphoglycerate dehydrogenase-like enzyme|uniref:D-2-hydroxyacid dehydrogenase n=1 Tax=Herbinix luporum TaxID=1679721 RepID=A0A0K8J7M7_9FIRM|nr:D-2-hydroxyacid dehydrogenase [Herbinix luporum]MDI9488841.1 D-2-hydroxyacid dehydrogenase [Bacillota bacterium]CUH93342.1 hypothetical protein SD1D_1798 [Herbinix luporum]HHT56223.1 D-2-hydroxyacid dehydrogenase [Herbinix luporum]
MALNILVISNKTFSLDHNQKELIEKTAKGAIIKEVYHSKLREEILSEAEIIFGLPRPNQLKMAEKLRWLQLISAGAEGYIDLNLYKNKDILLTNSRGVYSLPMAEHVFAMILAHNRNIQEYALLKKDKSWNKVLDTKDLYGSTIGIIGLGDIGIEVAKRAKAWGVRVLALKRTPSKKPDYVDELYLGQEIDDLLRQSDYIVLSLPATKKTKGIISEEKLRIMKPNAFLVNVGRGQLIDQEALIKALSNNWIGGAGLDVMTPEPLPYDSPLWELPNVIITQHSSYMSRGNNKRRFEMFIENLRRYLNKENLINIVDFSEGY